MVENLSGFKILLFENNSLTVRSWLKLFKPSGLNIEISSNLAELENRIKEQGSPLILLNQLLLGETAMEVKAALQRLQSLSESELKLIIYPLFPKAALDIKAIIKKQITWPLNAREQMQLIEFLAADLKNAAGQLMLGDDIATLLRPYLVFRSKVMREGLALLPRIARTPYNVLITGQTGTGKEMVARAIHSLSLVKDEYFIALNSAAIPENLVESELFGHVKGAFTGASQNRVGRFEQAKNGTLFLDEIGDVPPPVQVKLLRAIEEKQITPVGSDKAIEVSPRLITATSIDLQQAVARGQFREDLFYRLNILAIHLPPLSARVEDISLLAWHFLNEVSKELNKPTPELTPPAIAWLEQQPWPGNVRQLKNFMVRLSAMSASDKRVIELKDLNDASAAGDASKTAITESSAGVFIPWGTTIEEAEKSLLNYALTKTKNNKAKAARVLGISSRHIARKLKDK